MSEVAIQSPTALTSFGASSTASQDYTRISSAVNLDLGPQTNQDLNASVAISATLPSASGFPGKVYRLRSLGPGVISVTRSTADGGGVLLVLNPGEEVELVSTGVTGVAVNQGFVQVQRTPGATSLRVVTGAQVMTSQSARILLVDPAAVTVNVDLPLESLVPGQMFKFVNTGDGTQLVALRTSVGAPILSLMPGESVELLSTGAAWVQIEGVERKGVAAVTLTGGLVLADESANYLVLSHDNGGAYIVNMPPVASNRGRLMIIRARGGAGGGDTITFNQPGGGAVGAGVVVAGTGAMVTLLLACDGATWISLGGFTPVANSF